MCPVTTAHKNKTRVGSAHPARSRTIRLAVGAWVMLVGAASSECPQTTAGFFTRVSGVQLLGNAEALQTLHGVAIEVCAWHCIGGIHPEPCLSFNFVGSGSSGTCALSSASAVTLPLVPAPTFTGYAYYHRSTFECDPPDVIVLASTEDPAVTATEKPTAVPSSALTAAPTGPPTARPTGVPSPRPTGLPIHDPTFRPSQASPDSTTVAPSTPPTTIAPSVAPSTTAPSGIPTSRPSRHPTGTPTAMPVAATLEINDYLSTILPDTPFVVLVTYTSDEAATIKVAIKHGESSGHIAVTAMSVPASVAQRTVSITVHVGANVLFSSGFFVLTYITPIADTSWAARLAAVKTAADINLGSATTTVASTTPGSSQPTLAPTDHPSPSPTALPSLPPSVAPTSMPSTSSPTVQPSTAFPTVRPTSPPSRHPTHPPATQSPTIEPTPGEVTGLCRECEFGSSGPCLHLVTGLCLPYDGNGRCMSQALDCHEFNVATVASSHAPPSPADQRNGASCNDLSALWVDSEGDDCATYATAKWCEDGGYGSNWGDSSIEFHRFAIGHQHAGNICCACGGGHIVQEPMDVPEGPLKLDGMVDHCHLICINVSQSFVCSADSHEFESQCHAECEGITDWQERRCASTNCLDCGFESQPVCASGQTYMNACWARCVTDEPWERGTCQYVEAVSRQAECSYCADNFEPVCGQNGATYPNSCHAGCLGQYPWTNGICGHGSQSVPTTLPTQAPSRPPSSAPTGASASAQDEVAATDSAGRAVWAGLLAVVVVAALVMLATVLMLSSRTLDSRDPFDPVTDQEILELGNILDTKLEHLSSAQDSGMSQSIVSDEQSQWEDETIRSRATSSANRAGHPQAVTASPISTNNEENLRYYLDMIGKIALGGSAHAETVASPDWSGTSTPSPSHVRRGSSSSPMLWRKNPSLTSPKFAGGRQSSTWATDDIDDGPSFSPHRPWPRGSVAPHEHPCGSQTPERHFVSNAECFLSPSSSSRTYAHRGRGASDGDPHTPVRWRGDRARAQPSPAHQSPRQILPDQLYDLAARSPSQGAVASPWRQARDGLHPSPLRSRSRTPKSARSFTIDATDTTDTVYDEPHFAHQGTP